MHVMVQRVRAVKSRVGAIPPDQRPVNLKTPMRNPSPYATWYTAITPGRMSSARGSSERVNGSVEAAHASRYKNNPVANEAAIHEATVFVPNNAASAIPTSELRIQVTNATGTACRQDARARCFRITATFQKPYCRYWRNSAPMDARGV